MTEPQPSAHEQPAITAAAPVSAVEVSTAPRPEPVPIPVAELSVPSAQAAAVIPVEEKLVEYAPAVAAPAEPPQLKLDWSSDLIQIETDPLKLQEASAKAPADAAPERVKRVRQPLPPVSDEPLVQIETRKPGSHETARGGQTAEQTATGAPV